MKTSAQVLSSHFNPRIADSLRPLRYSVLAVICGSVMIAGFFFAARQHFSSIEFGIKNSRLRKQLDELEAEKRRLLLAKEVSMSPTELRKAVNKVNYSRTGSNSGRASEVATYRAGEVKVATAIQKTVFSRPVITVDEGPRAQKLERPAKRELTTKEKKS